MSGRARALARVRPGARVRRPILFAIVAAFVVLTAAAPAARPVRAAAPPDPKVVVIVGATHGTTPEYRRWADVVVAEAKKYTSNVVKVYSPNATWSAVKSAMQGASVVVYMGHGNGFPSPYSSTLHPDKVDGFGLNAVAGQGDYNNKYYGESFIASGVTLAPNAVVILNHLCYASGNSEPGNPQPSLSVAHQRIDNFGAGFIKAGARAVIAEGKSGAEWWIKTLFTTRQSLETAFRNHPATNDHVVTFSSSRSQGYLDYSDPDSPTSGFYRSLVVRPGLSTVDVTGAPASDTGADPSDFVVPGNASVGPGGGTVFGGSDMTAEDGSLAAGTKVRLLSTASDTAAGRIFAVETFDDATTGYMDATSLIPRDSLGPMMWGLPDQLSFSPNGDGAADVLQLGADFSESVTWTAKVRATGGSVVWSSSGTGSSLAASWKGLNGGSPAPEGLYDLTVSASDSWGNTPVSREATVILDRHPQDRLAGPDRFSTAAAISSATFDPGVSIVYVATGTNFPDALAGAAAAGKAGAPVLLVGPTSIPTPTATELTRLAPGRIVVLGGSGVVSDTVLTGLKAYTSGSVTRLAGPDRFSTAAAISSATFDPGVSIVYVATGTNFPDALAGAAAAGKAGAPVLLVGPTSIPTPTATELTRLAPGRIVVLGGSGVVSDTVLTGLKAYTSGSVTRLAGPDRFSTAAAISSATFDPGVSIVYVATGTNFPDALAGAAAAGKAGAPVLLVGPTSIPTPTATELTRLAPGRIVVLGGSGVVSDTVKLTLQTYTAP